MSEETPDTETADATETAAPARKGKALSKSLNDRVERASKKKSRADVQAELRDLSKPSDTPAPPDLKKLYTRGGLLLAVVWVVAIIIRHWAAFAGAGALTAAAIAAVVWLHLTMKKTAALGSILKGADTEEGRKAALEKLDTSFKKGDAQAILAKAQLQMQDNPREALATLEKVNLEKELGPVAQQVRVMRAMIHLTLGETQEARALADAIDLGKQQDTKTRAMFAAVASEAWARTGAGKKAVDTLDLFNPEAPDMGDVRAQLWRSRAFAYAAVNDTKGIARAVKKLADINPHLLGMFVGQKKVHPLLEKEAKNVVMRMGIVPRRTVRQKM